MPELKDRIANEDFVKAFTADQTGIFIRWLCAVMDGVFELALFRSRTANAAKQRVHASHTGAYASETNLTNPAPSAI